MDKKEKAKMLKKRNEFRETVCAGCRDNYYNWPKGRSERGDVAVAEDKYCMMLKHATKRGCRCKR